jgi:MFS family permease
VGWYGATYLITTGGFQLIWGKFYVLFPIKWVFLSSITIFELGSLLCGATPNSVGLILGRTIAGVGSAGLFSGAMVTIAYSVPLKKRPIYFGVIGGVCDRICCWPIARGCIHGQGFMEMVLLYQVGASLISICIC